MLFSFKRNNEKVSDKTDCFKGNLLQQFDEANLRLQYKCAHWLERKTAHLSRKSWIVILICFIVFTSGCSIYVMIGSFSETTASVIPITPFAKSINTMRTGDERDKIKVSISKAEFEKTVRFRKYMDSLGRSPTGKKL
ncbi:hypothetical protein [Flavobacterium yafengii]|uniref:Transmembrane protein n=2 Tax=Flavobacterium yafengii TaxID=3041253 RepID=A0AAW6TMQ1_9FLAO|nr:hypothetical protein [Flavobacterium yafengii]MDI5950241.1 hypothetical protein [Flavobacterium yafengii]